MVDEFRERVGDHFRTAGGTQDRFSRVDRKTAGEHSEATEHRSVVGVEQRKAPRDGVTQRALAVGPVARPSRE
jgi:hypothetical protein